MDDGQAGSRAGVAGVAARWAATGSTVDVATWTRVALALLDEVDGEPRPGTTWVPDEIGSGAGEPSVDDCRRLREALEIALLDGLPAPDALALQRRIAALVDQLVDVVTARRLDVLARTARVDALTGLDNRRAGEETIARAIAHAQRHDRDLALAVVDLDGLKQINDLAGHLAGDDALRDLADALRRNLRAGDRAARYGGDEFVVVSPDTRADDLATLFERVRADAPAFTVGIADLSETDGGPDALLALADARLYETRAIARRPVAPRYGRTLLLAAALCFGLAASGAAEAVHRLRGGELADGASVLWRTLLVLAPVATVAFALRSASTGSHALRRAGAAASVALLALLASLSPLATASPDGGLARDAAAVSTTTSTPASTTTTASTTTSTTMSTVSTTAVPPRTVASRPAASPAPARAPTTTTTASTPPATSGGVATGAAAVAEPASRPTTTTTMATRQSCKPKKDRGASADAPGRNKPCRGDRRP